MNNRLAEARIKRGLSLSEVSRATRINPKKLSEYERGRPIRKEVLRQLCMLYGCSMDEIQ